MAKQLQQFEFGTIKRSEISLAEYNPRIIDESNQKKLVRNIRQNGLIEPVVWNKRTGVLVGGHQRIAAADKIFRSDYDVPVAIIDVDERQEKILNVTLNNSTSQGEWNLNLLESMTLDNDIGFDELGFDKGDVEFMFGKDIMNELDEPEQAENDENGQSDEYYERTDSPELPDAPDEIDEVENEKDKLAEFNEKKASFRRKDEDNTIIDFYTKIVFPDNETKQEFYKKANIPAYEEYITWDMVKRYFDKGSEE